MATNVPAQYYPSGTVIVMPPLGPEPSMVVCPKCHQRQLSKVRATSSGKTHIVAVLLCGVCCCCIPYCVDSCKNRNHYCSSCDSFLGTYKN